MAAASLCGAQAASAEDIPPWVDPPANSQLTLAYPENSAMIPPICYTLGTCGAVDYLPVYDPANGEDENTDYTHSFDAFAVDATQLTGDGTYTERSTALEAATAIANRRYVHCSYAHHHGHHRRASNGVLYHHYHNSSTTQSYWSSQNSKWLEVYTSPPC